MKAVLPIKEDQRKHRLRRGSTGGRPPNFDAERYKERNTVERCVNKLRQFRAVATRHRRRIDTHLAPTPSHVIIGWARGWNR